jgi:hypothetical protein
VEGWSGPLICFPTFRTLRHVVFPDYKCFPLEQSKTKVKLSLCLRIKPWRGAGVEEIVHAFLTVQFDGGEYSVSCSGHCIRKERTSFLPIGCELDIMSKRKILLSPCRESKRDPTHTQLFYLLSDILRNKKAKSCATSAYDNVCLKCAVNWALLLKVLFFPQCWNSLYNCFDRNRYYVLAFISGLWGGEGSDDRLVMVIILNSARTGVYLIVFSLFKILL